MATVVDSDRFLYNGLELSVYRSSVKIKVIRDKAQRTVIGNEITLYIAGYLLAADGDTTDDYMEIIRRHLKPAGELRYIGKGFGDLHVNGSSRVKDIAWGPHIDNVDAKPVGDTQAWMVSFHVTTLVPECPNARYRMAPADFWVEYNVGHDKHGYVEIQYQGELVIPITRTNVNSRVIPDTVDNYQERVVPDVTPGFQRDRRNTRISADRRTLSFHFSDRQLYSPLPKFVTEAPIKYSLSSNLRQGFTLWNGSLSGTLHVAVGGPNKAFAFLAFLNLAHDRINLFRQLPNIPNINLPFGIQVPQVLDNLLRNSINAMLQNTAPAINSLFRIWAIVTDFRIDDDVNGNSFSAHIGWRVIKSGPIFELLTMGKMWQPWPNASFATWKQSMDQTVNRARGAADVQFPNKTETIIDLCTDASGKNLQPSVTGKDLFSIVAVNPASRRPNDALNTGPLPPPDQSWLMYECRLIYSEPEPRYAVHQPTGGATNPPKSAGLVASDPHRQQEQSTGGVIGSTRSDVESILPEVRSPTPRVRLVGRALRLGHQVPIPKLVQLDGKQAVQNRIIEAQSWMASRYLWLPIYAASWDVEYIMGNGPATQLPVPGNPKLGLDGK